MTLAAALIDENPKCKVTGSLPVEHLAPQLHEERETSRPTSLWVFFSNYCSIPSSERQERPGQKRIFTIAHDAPSARNAFF